MEIALFLPILTVALSWGICAAQIIARRTKIPRDVFFLGTVFSIGVYAASEFLHFHTSNAEQVLLFARLSYVFLSLTTFLLVLFTVSLHRRPNIRWLTLVPLTIASIALVWTAMIPGIVRTPIGWEMVLDAPTYLLFDLYLYFYATAAVAHTFNSYRHLQARDRILALNTLALTVSYVLVMIGGALLIVSTVHDGQPDIPVVSTLMSIPLFATIPLVFPSTWERWVGTVRSRESHRPEVIAVNLMHADGTLIGSKSMFPSRGFDFEKLSKTLTVVQSFVKTSFPSAHDSLRTLDHEGMRILVEKGEKVYLVLIITGRENDFLRRQMREALAAFESKNAFNILNGWGEGSGLLGTASTLDQFFARESLF